MYMYVHVLLTSMQKDEQCLTVKDYVGVIKVCDTEYLIMHAQLLSTSLSLNTNIHVHCISVGCYILSVLYFVGCISNEEECLHSETVSP